MAPTITPVDELLAAPGPGATATVPTKTLLLQVFLG